MIKAITTSFILFILVLAFSGSPLVEAEVLDPVCTDPKVTSLPVAERPAVCRSNTTENPIIGPNGVLTRVINLLSIVVGIAAVLSIIISALRLTLSGGDPNSVSSARRGILYAVIGLVIAAIAQLLVRFILSKV